MSFTDDLHGFCAWNTFTRRSIIKCSTFNAVIQNELVTKVLKNGKEEGSHVLLCLSMQGNSSGGMNKTFHEALGLAINENSGAWRIEEIVPVFQIDLFIFELPQTLSPFWQ